MAVASERENSLMAPRFRFTQSKRSLPTPICSSMCDQEKPRAHDLSSSRVARDGMELVPEVSAVEGAVDALLWDRADRPKRLAALRTLLAAAACEPGVEAIR